MALLHFHCIFLHLNVKILQCVCARARVCVQAHMWSLSSQNKVTIQFSTAIYFGFAMLRINQSENVIKNST